MSGTKRLAKRSIIGTRVSALWQQDGRYYPGVICAQAAEETATTKALYVVHFDDGFDAAVTGKDIIGPGFQTGPSGRLKHAQKVFVTMNGREVGGVVAHHDRRHDEVIINVKNASGEEFTINRKVDEVRLMESRKSARLVDQATDYSKLADLQLSEPKKRAVSHNIDVPSAFKQQPRRHRDSCGDTETSEPLDADFHDITMMDETVAAMVLTSLSVSPKSPTLHTQHRAPADPLPVAEAAPLQEHSYVSSSLASSGFSSGHSERDDPSPPHLSESAPAAFHFPCRRDVDLGETQGNLQSYRQQKEERVKYRCTWRGCVTVCLTANEVERHIRRTHFDCDSDLELSDKEEEFYYEEVSDDDGLDSVTQSFADMYTSSPPTPIPDALDVPGTFDHDYQRKEEKLRFVPPQASSVPVGIDLGVFSQSGTGTATSLPITIPEGQIKRSLSWQIHPPVVGNGMIVSPPQRTSKLTPQERLQIHQAQSPKSHMLSMSPLKSSGPHRKPRSEVRKCRKVYGMDNRDQWCTQCKWKKACTRFLD